MAESRIELDWSRLLGFDQANPGPDPLRHSPKIGQKDAIGFVSAATPPLRAKVGDKRQIRRDSPGTIHALRAKVGPKDTLKR
ncbi:MAG: hypothetical protein SGJ07_11240 [Rhodospirillaceae bacterium]|nr:hypothetical protein [Rhodospirillaceae bacterium]